MSWPWGSSPPPPPPSSSSSPSSAPSSSPAPSPAPSCPPAGALPLHRLREPLLRRLGRSLDRAAEGRGWRQLAERVAHRGRCRLSSLELEQCSLKVLEPEGSPSLCLLRLMGERGCTVMELMEVLQAMEHTEVLQFLNPPGIKIVINPGSKAVLAGQLVKLCCRASGHPFVQYQWFKMKKEIPHGNSSELIFNPVQVSDAGFYVCRVNNDTTFEFSQWAQLDVCELMESSYGNLDGFSESKLQICIEPKPQKLIPGDTLVLHCVAVGSPIPHYQWIRNGFPIADETKKLFMVPFVDKEHQGTYWCHIYNDQDSQNSKKVEVIIDELTDYGQNGTKEKSTAQAFAKDKVALLIGNMSYLNHPKLKAPLVDVYELTNLLRQLDFKVVSLLDLTEHEMRNAVDEFLLLLDKGVYGLLYYAGHGYENYGNSFMVPIDAPNPYRSANCLCVQSILKLMQEKETGLNVFLLDMCRKRNDYDDTIPILDALKVTANIVFGYATCQGAEAFEIQHSGLANGIFMKFLKDRLLEDKKITVLLDGVAEDMGKCHLTKGKQALEIRSSLSEKRALTDPIQRTVCSPESLVRNLQWAKAHELPESMYLEFKCGVEIQLGFAAEFSNVMIIYTRIIHKPPEIMMCEAYVTDLPLDLDVDPKHANKGTPEETGSYLVSKELPKHCLYTRLSSLQKLKEHLIFTVHLSYNYQGMEDTVDERQEVNVGKPLIAKLDIYRGFGRKSCFQTSLMSSPSNLTPISGAAEHYHSFPNSFPGAFDPHPGNSGGDLPSISCHCSRTSDMVFSSQSTQDYSSQFCKSNIPVETTDELPFTFSDKLKFSEK
uniref:Paracaspase n=1 Tax=Ornithorhynchus anatinus TaxID=9258 RepID=A0A6I8P9U2_ORNAN